MHRVIGSGSCWLEQCEAAGEKSVVYAPCFASLVFLVELVSQHISELPFTHQGFYEMLRARVGGETPQIQGIEILYLSLRASSK